MKELKTERDGRSGVEGRGRKTRAVYIKPRWQRHVDRRRREGEATTKGALGYRNNGGSAATAATNRGRGGATHVLQRFECIRIQILSLSCIGLEVFNALQSAPREGCWITKQRMRLVAALTAAVQAS